MPLTLPITPTHGNSRKRSTVLLNHDVEVDSNNPKTQSRLINKEEKQLNDRKRTGNMELSISFLLKCPIPQTVV